MRRRAWFRGMNSIQRRREFQQGQAQEQEQEQAQQRLVRRWQQLGQRLQVQEQQLPVLKLRNSWVIVGSELVADLWCRGSQKY
jgi:hypothetical protein